jgi:hypothetical protein
MAADLPAGGLKLFGRQVYNHIINPTTERVWTGYLEPETGAARD